MSVTGDFQGAGLTMCSQQHCHQQLSNLLHISRLRLEICAVSVLPKSQTEGNHMSLSMKATDPDIAE
jgi:hypothetical protein